jgi:hypothetical protein
MWTAREEAEARVRIEECRLNQLVAEARFRIPIQIAKFLGEVECLLLQARLWAATHGGGGIDALAKPK